jgi:hypothetical protein
MRLVYISGPYSPGHGRSISENIAIAREHAIKVWERGDVALCPHLNTAHFEDDCSATYDDYISGDLLMVERCDVIYMLPYWEESGGASWEHEHAIVHGIDVEYAVGASVPE